ncbi:MAG: transglutaminase domain-containing protein [Spirochaetales bacterium]|nr:transglutaminase domain-containing protein [Spirochaetales bacterium]
MNGTVQDSLGVVTYDGIKSKVGVENMQVTSSSNKMGDYLKSDDVIDYEKQSIAQLADMLFQKSTGEIEFIKAAYEFVRDNISHSADIKEDIITCSASQVMEAGHGICFAKSHLLAALLRCKSVPTGFCYQKLILDDETAPVLIYHGLNGVYIEEQKKWIRLDARGNKVGVNAQFSTDTEQLAFPVRPEKGEEDGFVIYPNPDKKILERLRKYKTRTELWDDLPTELENKT